MSVREPDIGVRMHIAVEIAERTGQGRTERIAEVEQHAPSAVERVRQQESTWRHLEFRVVWDAALPRDCDRREGLAVLWRLGIGVDDGEEVAAGLRVVTSPDKGCEPFCARPLVAHNKQNHEAGDLAHGGGDYAPKTIGNITGELQASGDYRATGECGRDNDVINDRFPTPSRSRASPASVPPDP